MQPPEIDHHRAKTQEQQHNLTLTHTLWQSTVKFERGKAGILRCNQATEQRFHRISRIREAQEGAAFSWTFS